MELLVGKKEVIGGLSIWRTTMIVQDGGSAVGLSYGDRHEDHCFGGRSLQTIQNSEVNTAARVNLPSAPVSISLVGYDSFSALIFREMQDLQHLGD